MLIIGQEKGIPISHIMLFPLGWFDVFATSAVAMRSTRADTLSNRVGNYYCLLRTSIENDLRGAAENDGKARSCPSCMQPWLWRTALGVFQHDDHSAEELLRDAEQSDLYNTPFPVYCKKLFE
jgi:hypothetical protein